MEAGLTAGALGERAVEDDTVEVEVSAAGDWGYENPGYGLTWWLTTREGERFFAHSGSVAGYTAFVMGNRTRGFGIALLTTGIGPIRIWCASATWPWT